MSERMEGMVEITIWCLSILFGVATAIFTGIKGGDLLKALGFGFLGAISFIGITLMIYFTIHSRVTLEKDGK